jgi:osmotically-inducible protein OsmY
MMLADMADLDFNYSMRISEKNGVVTVNGTAGARGERDKVNEQLRELTGVNRVQDDLDQKAPVVAATVAVQ